MKKNKVLKLIIVLVLLVFLVILVESKSYNDSDVMADNGQINLSDWDFSEAGVVRLKGNWELFYGELLSPEEVEARTADNYYQIPGNLADQVPGKKQGYMTLHLKVKVPQNEIYGITFNSMFTASDIWINGVYLDGHGKVGMSISEEKPIYRPTTMYFPPVNKEVDIVIQTSTYLNLEPSISKLPIFGTKQQIQNIGIKSYASDGFLIGILFLMAILSFGFYFTKPRQKSNIYFSCLCILMMLRCMVFNSKLAVQFWPDMPFEILSKTSALTFYLFVMFYALFLESVFNKSALLKKISIVFGVVFTVICLFTNCRIYDCLGIPAQIMVSCFVIYEFYVFINEIRNKNSNAWKYFIPFIILILCFLNDALVNDSIICNPYYGIYGMAVFIIIQSMYLVDDYLDKHRKLDSLNKDGLTSLYNNKHIKEILSNQIAQYNNVDSNFTLIMIDIDDFKEINDEFGHMFGDKVLVDIAKILSNDTENTAYAGRFGGDEFVLIMPDIKEKEAIDIAEGIAKNVEALSEKYKIDRKITLSMGIYENKTDDLIECINKADSYMYKAKTLGKSSIYSFKE